MVTAKHEPCAWQKVVENTAGWCNDLRLQTKSLSFILMCICIQNTVRDKSLLLTLVCEEKVNPSNIFTKKCVTKHEGCRGRAVTPYTEAISLNAAVWGLIPNPKTFAVCRPPLLYVLTSLLQIKAPRTTKTFLKTVDICSGLGSFLLKMLFSQSRRSSPKVITWLISWGAEGSSLIRSSSNEWWL